MKWKILFSTTTHIWPMALIAPFMAYKGQVMSVFTLIGVAFVFWCAGGAYAYADITDERKKQ